MDEGLAGSCRCGGGCAAIDRLGRDVGSVHCDAHWSEETYWIRAPSFAREHAGVLALCASSGAQGVKGNDQSNHSKDRGGVNGGRVFKCYRRLARKTWVDIFRKKSNGEQNKQISCSSGAGRSHTSFEGSNESRNDNVRE